MNLEYQKMITIFLLYFYFHIFNIVINVFVTQSVRKCPITIIFFQGHSVTVIVRANFIYLVEYVSRQ